MSATSSPSRQNDAALDPDKRIKRLAETSQKFDVTITHSINMYVKTAKEIYRSARSYLEDGSLEFAFVLFTRFLTLVVEKLPERADYKEIPAEDRQYLNKTCKLVFPLAEDIKKKLREEFQKEHVVYLLEQERMKAEREKQRLKAEEEERRLREAQMKMEAMNLDRGRNNFSNFDYVPSAPSYKPSSPVDKVAEPPRNDSSSSIANIPTPHFDRSVKPARILSPVHTGLRQLRIPADLPSKFLELAKVNTSKNCETCGILGGKVVREKLVITHMIIPKQTGCSDSCSMQKEEEIFFFQDAFNLMTLGWIHTHPSQTAFLSSVDLHTQYSYQQLMPEAIAIVCAPTHNQTGIFQINPSTGMETIAKCANTTAFHPHPETSVPLFHEASHIVMDSTLTVAVEDLRNIP